MAPAPTAPPSARATAVDVLVVDDDPAVQTGLARVLGEAGLEVTALADHDRARDQLANRFFAVMLVDLDDAKPEAAVSLIRFARERAPLTAVIVLSVRRTFEAIAAAFRAGAFDVVPKTQEQLPYLRARVLEAVGALKASDDQKRLMEEVREVHERFLAQMVGLFRQVTELEERLLVAEGEGEPEPAPPPLELLLVDDEPHLASAIREAIERAGGWRVRTVASGGSALDAASQQVPQILVMKESLPDLPPSMLLTTIGGANPDLLALIYRPPGATPGEVRLRDGARTSTVVPSFTQPSQLVAMISDLGEAVTRRRRERRQLAAFRKQHSDFLKLYTGLKQRLGSGR